MILSGAMLALGVGSSALAGDVFNACSKDTTGKLRGSSVLANATPVCKSTETPRTWGQGISVCGPQEATATAAANTFAVLNLTCTTGHATGASAIWHTPFDAADNGPFYILPRSDTTWTVVPYNHTGVSQDFRFFVQCCS